MTTEQLILSSHNGYFESNTTLLEPICSSENNDYIPLFVRNTGKVMRKSDKKVFLYSLFAPLSPNIFPCPSKIINKFEGSDYNTLYRFKNFEEYLIYYHAIIYYPNHDILFPEVLYCLCVKSDYLFTLDPSNLDVSQFMLIISNNLMNEDKHKPLFLKAKQHILNIQKLNIDTMYTDDINRRCFKNCVKTPKFNNVGEMIESTTSINDYLKTIYPLN